MKILKFESTGNKVIYSNDPLFQSSAVHLDCGKTSTALIYGNIGYQVIELNQAKLKMWHFTGSYVASV